MSNVIRASNSKTAVSTVLLIKASDVELCYLEAGGLRGGW